MGPATISELLTYANPQEYVIFNKTTILCYAYLDIPDMPKYNYQYTGKKYAEVCAIAKEIAAELKKAGADDYDLLDVDYFMWDEILSLAEKKTSDTPATPEVKKPVTVKEFYILSEQAQAAQNQYEPYFAVAKGIHTARDLVNEPANVITPITFAKRAEELQKYGLQTEVYDPNQLRAKGLNMMLGVAQGSVNPPRLVVVQWRGCPEDKNTHVVLVGKGVTFDSGGLSLKPAKGMEDMKEDLAGAATALGTLQTLAMRKAKVNAAAVMAMVENMPSGTAQRPGDIVKSLSGITVEVINTDAEGRLVLGDALWYAQERFNAPVVIDLASLTGAIVVALGTEYAGLFSNNDDLAGQMEKASADSGEKIWRMPMDDFFDDQIVSDIADIRNTATSGRAGGSITAAAFLKRFIMPQTKWAHLDIAGVALKEKASVMGPKGGSGFGVQLLNRFIKDNLEK